MRIRRILAYGAVTTIALGAGLTGGAAFAGVPTVFTPAGVSFDGPSKPMPDPEYAANARALSYGSLREANSPENEPDLIRAITTDGKEGYVYKSDLDNATGVAAQKEFDSPADALAWHKQWGSQTRTIPVYKLDGSTVIGEFVVSPSS